MQCLLGSCGAFDQAHFQIQTSEGRKLTWTDLEENLHPALSTQHRVTEPSRFVLTHPLILPESLPSAPRAFSVPALAAQVLHLPAAPQFTKAPSPLLIPVSSRSQPAARVPREPRRVSRFRLILAAFAFLSHPVSIQFGLNLMLHNSAFCYVCLFLSGNLAFTHRVLARGISQLRSLWSVPVSRSETTSFYLSGKFLCLFPSCFISRPGKARHPFPRPPLPSPSPPASAADAAPEAPHAPRGRTHQ